jgi:hypothetical protein
MSAAVDIDRALNSPVCVFIADTLLYAVIQHVIIIYMRIVRSLVRRQARLKIGAISDKNDPYLSLR